MARGRVGVSTGQPHTGFAKQRASAADRTLSQYRSLLLRDSLGRIHQARPAARQQQAAGQPPQQ